MQGVNMYKKKFNRYLERLLLTRVIDFKDYLRFFLGLNTVKKDKYFLQLPAAYNENEINRIIYLIRGQKYKPAIFILGVMPRSGTNFLADLMKRHKSIFSYTSCFYEFPILSFTDKVKNLQSEFDFEIYRYPATLYSYEFSAYINSGMMKNLQEKTEPKKIMLFKYPNVYYLDLFKAFFPRDYLLLILRDGRDVVESSVRTFKRRILKKNFSEYARKWDYAARCILKYVKGGCRENKRILVIRYEDLFAHPKDSILKILDMINLKAYEYDFEGLKRQPVRGSCSLKNEKGEVDWQPKEKKGNFNPIGRWRKWTEEEKRIFKFIAGKSLIATGYAKDNYW